MLKNNIINKKEVKDQLAKMVKEKDLPKQAQTWLKTTYFNHVIEISEFDLAAHPDTALSFNSIMEHLKTNPKIVLSTMEDYVSKEYSDRVEAKAKEEAEKKAKEEAGRHLRGEATDVPRPRRLPPKARKKRSIRPMFNDDELQLAIDVFTSLPVMFNIIAAPEEDWVSTSEMYQNIRPDFSEFSDICDVLGSDFFESRLSKLGKISVDHVHDQHDAWVNYMTNIKNTEEDFESLRVLKKLDNGMSIVELISEQNFSREGFMQNNCIASYYSKRKRMKYRCFSLRDEDNKPIVSISAKVKTVLNNDSGDIELKFTLDSARSTTWKCNKACTDEQLAFFLSFFEDELGFEIELKTEREEYNRDKGKELLSAEERNNIDDEEDDDDDEDEWDDEEDDDDDDEDEEDW